jgi:hypothetical protein
MRGKTQTPKLNIQYEMKMLDQKSRTFYDDLDEEEKKKFSTYLMIRWGSSVQGSPELQEYYLHATNQRLNKNFFDIYNHPKLQWLCASTISPGLGVYRHTWIGHKKKNPDESKKLKTLKEIFPTAKLDDLQTLSSITDKKEILEYKKKFGE